MATLLIELARLMILQIINLWSHKNMTVSLILFFLKMQLKAKWRISGQVRPVVLPNYININFTAKKTTKKHCYKPTFASVERPCTATLCLGKKEIQDSTSERFMETASYQRSFISLGESKFGGFAKKQWIQIFDSFFPWVCGSLGHLLLRIYSQLLKCYRKHFHMSHDC